MIRLKNVRKEFITKSNEKIIPISNLNLHIKDGEQVVLKGRSGSGKSTLISLIGALSKPTSGEILINGENLSKLTDIYLSNFRRENLGIIFQKFNLIEDLSVFDNVLVPLIPLNLDEKKVKFMVEDALDKFNILHKAKEKTQKLSGGERQRVAIARSFVNNPKVILADEPTASLDVKLRENFIEILKDLKKYKKTILITTHDEIFENLNFIDRILKIENGKIDAVYN